MNALIRRNPKVLKTKYDYIGSSCYFQTNRSYRKINDENECKHHVKLQSMANLSEIRNLISKPQNFAATLDLLNYKNVTYNYPQRLLWSFNDASLFQKRNIHLSTRLFEQASSKVEATIQAIQNKQKEEEKESKVDAMLSVSDLKINMTESAVVHKETAKKTQLEITKPEVVKKSLGLRIWEEVLHYYHGFRLLFIDINVCRRLLWSVLQGNTLTRRENRLLIQTTSDLFRLLPFSIFIIIPFMELLLPVFIKFFPGMLPSTFQTSKDREDKLKQSLTVKLEVAKFLQKTLDEMTLESRDHKSEEAKQFSQFFQKIKNPNEKVSNADIIKFSKRFEDEITLFALSREQLVALCRILGVNTIGTTNLLRFQLSMKMRNLAADDKIICKEGVDALNLYELQLANKNRGMRAYGLSEQKLRSQLQEWIELSLNEKVPPTLLLLSRALTVSEDVTTTDKLKDTIASLPDTLAVQAKAAIGELEGKVDNKTKIEIIKEEVRKIQEEKEEEKEEQKQKKKVEQQERHWADEKDAELLADKAPILVDKAEEIEKPELVIESSHVQVQDAQKLKDIESISPKDVQLLDEALAMVGKQQLLKEKEVIKELKEEIEDYKEDVEELKKISQEDKKVDSVKESKAAQLLYKKVNSMIGRLDKVLEDIETKQVQKSAAQPNLEDSVKVSDLQMEPEVDVKKNKEEDLIKVDDLVQAIKGLVTVSEEGRIKTIEKFLSKIDFDQDGHMKVNDVLKVIEAIGKENVNLNEKQIEELLDLIVKEDCLEAEDKIEKALAKEKAEKEAVNAAKQMSQQNKEVLTDKAPILEDKAKDISDAPKNTESEIKTSLGAEIANEVAEKQKEKLLPKDVPSIPPAIPTSKPSNTKDKML